MDSDVNNLITQHRKSVELGDSVERLQRSADFKLVIEEHLFKKEVNALVSDLSKLNKMDEQYNEVVRKLDAISFLQNYLHHLIQEGTHASASIREAQYLLQNDEG